MVDDLGTYCVFALVQSCWNDLHIWWLLTMVILVPGTAHQWLHSLTTVACGKSQAHRMAVNSCYLALYKVIPQGWSSSYLTVLWSVCFVLSLSQWTAHPPYILLHAYIFVSSLYNCSTIISVIPSCLNVYAQHCFFLPFLHYHSQFSVAVPCTTSHHDSCLRVVCDTCLHSHMSYFWCSCLFVTVHCSKLSFLFRY